MKEEDFDLSVSEFDSGVYLDTSMDLVEATQLAKEILHNKQFADRCKKDGILTYDRECNELKEKINKLIQELENRGMAKFDNILPILKKLVEKKK